MKDTPKIEIDNIGYHSCLCHPDFHNPIVNYLIQLSDAYEKGITPETGAFLDQSARTMELISLIDSLKQEHRQKLQELEAKRNKHG